MKRQPQYPCPTCGGFARIPVSGGSQKACARCGTVLDPLPYMTNSGGSLLNPTPIRQGMKAVIGGKEFWAVGLIRYEESAEDEVSTWYEWVLLNPDGDVCYLESDEGRWTMTEPWETDNTGPLVGAFGATAGTSIPVDTGTATLREAGTCTVTAFQGEIPWPIRIRERLRYVDLDGPDGRMYSGEISEATGEMEWFKGRRLDDRQVLIFFGLTHLVTELDRRGAKKRQQGSFGCFLIALAVVAFIFCGIAGSRGKVVGQGSATGAQVGEEGQRFGPYSLTQVNRVYRLRLWSSLTSTSMWVQGVLENTDASPFFDVDQEFWDESGTDSDGAWHEWQLQVSKDFRLDQRRDVYVRLFADPEAAAANAPISFALEEGVLDYGPFLAYGLTGMGIGIVFLIMAGTGGKVWDGMAK